MRAEKRKWKGDPFGFPARIDYLRRVKGFEQRRRGNSSHWDCRSWRLDLARRPSCKGCHLEMLSLGKFCVCEECPGCNAHGRLIQMKGLISWQLHTYV